MKTNPSFRLGCALFLLTFSTLASAQTRATPAPSTAGYWNVVTDLASSERPMVRFYNSRHQLVHEEPLASRHLALNRYVVRRRTASQLNTALQQVLRSQPSNCAPELAQQRRPNCGA